MAEWQTRYFEGVVGVFSCGFKSHSPHHMALDPFGFNVVLFWEDNVCRRIEVVITRMTLEMWCWVWKVGVWKVCWSAGLWDLVAVGNRAVLRGILRFLKI